MSFQDRGFGLSKETRSKLIKLVIPYMGENDKFMQFYDKLSIALSGFPEEEIMFAFYFAGIYFGTMLYTVDPKSSVELLTDIMVAKDVLEMNEEKE